MVALARDGADVVAASRYMRGGRQIGGPMFKSLLSRLAGLSLHHLAGLPIHDATSNFRLYRRSFLDSVEIESRAGFELALELTVKAHRAGRKIAEVPTVWRPQRRHEPFPATQVATAVPPLVLPRAQARLSVPPSA